MDSATALKAFSDFIAFSYIHPIVAAIMAVLGTTLALAYFYKKFIADSKDAHKEINDKLDKHDLADVTVAKRLDALEQKVDDNSSKISNIDGKLDIMLQFMKPKGKNNGPSDQK